MRERQPGDLSLAELQAQVGSPLRIVAEDGTRISTRITEVRDRSTSTRRQGIQQFSVKLQSREGRLLPQGVHRVEHEELGSCSLFIVPAAQTGSESEYAISFTRFVA